MLLTHVGTYVRPTVGFGRNGEKPYDWGVTFGFSDRPVILRTVAAGRCVPARRL